MSPEQKPTTNAKDNLPPFPTERNVVIPPKEHRDDKHEKKKMSRGKKLGMWAAGGVLVGSIVPAGLALSLSSGDSTPNQDPSVSRPENPGVTEDTAPDTSDQGAETETSQEDALEPIMLTPEQVTALQSGNPEQANPVWDETLRPAIENAMNQIANHDGISEGLSLDEVFTDQNARVQLADAANTFSTEDKQKFSVCNAAGNPDGSNGFCPPSMESEFKLGEKMSIDVVRLTMEDPLGEDSSNRHSINLVIKPFIDENGQLYVAAER